MILETIIQARPLASKPSVIAKICFDYCYFLQKSLRLFRQFLEQNFELNEFCHEKRTGPMFKSRCCTFSFECFLSHFAGRQKIYHENNDLLGYKSIVCNKPSVIKREELSASERFICK